MANNFHSLLASLANKHGDSEHLSLFETFRNDNSHPLDIAHVDIIMPATRLYGAHLDQQEVNEDTKEKAQC